MGRTVPTKTSRWPSVRATVGSTKLAREDVRLFVVFWDEYHIRPQIQEPPFAANWRSFSRTMLNATDLVAIMDPRTPMSHLVFSRDR
jgi:hypothetical protein